MPRLATAAAAAAAAATTRMRVDAVLAGVLNGAIDGAAAIPSTELLS